MRLLSARLIISLIVGVALVSLCTSAYQVVVTRRQMRRDLDRRAEVLGESLASNVEHDLERDAQRTLQRTVQQFANREHLRSGSLRHARAPDCGHDYIAAAYGKCPTHSVAVP